MSAVSAGASKRSAGKAAAVSKKGSTEKAAGSKGSGEVAEDSSPAKSLRLQGTATKSITENPAAVSGTGCGDAQICIGYYDASYLNFAKNRNTVDTTAWIHMCTDDVRRAVKHDGLNIVGLVGLAEYAEDAQNLPNWLQKHDSHLPTAILKYMSDKIPGTWEVWSLKNYGVMVNITEVNVIKLPQVVTHYVQADCKGRPMVALTVAPWMKTGHFATVLKDGLQVWIVENEGNAIYPLNPWARQSICQFLLSSAAPTAVWGGKMNFTLTLLADEGDCHVVSGGGDEAWTIIPSRNSTRNALVLHRGLGTYCDVEGIDIPCAKLATFFSVSISLSSGRAEKLTTGCDEKRQTSQLALDLSSHADEGDEVTKETVHALFKFLWWGHTHQSNSSSALQEGIQRLNAMTTEIQRVREQYSCVSKPAADYQFDESATRKIHNNYMHSHTWMNDDIKQDFRAQKGNTHQFVRTRFRVHCFQSWGGRWFFMYLVRYGTSSDIPAMLQVFDKFRESKEYDDIVNANALKTRTERAQKRKRDELRRQRHNSADAEEQYLSASREYQDLHRGSRGGVAQASWVHVVRDSIA